MRRTILKTLVGSAALAALRPALAQSGRSKAEGGKAAESSPGAPDWAGFEMATLTTERADSGRPYLEFLRVPSLTCGLYVLPAGGEDRQTPHKNDEIYHVVAGRAVLTVAGDEQRVAPGSVVYVRAGIEHRFRAIEEELRVLVFFALSGDPKGP